VIAAGFVAWRQLRVSLRPSYKRPIFHRKQVMPVIIWPVRGRAALEEMAETRSTLPAVLRSGCINLKKVFTKMKVARHFSGGGVNLGGQFMAVVFVGVSVGA
jgi:hypothetical protein